MTTKRKYNHHTRRVVLYASPSVRTTDILDAVERYGFRKRHSRFGAPDLCDHPLNTRVGVGQLYRYRAPGRKRVVVTVRVRFEPTRKEQPQ